MLALVGSGEYLPLMDEVDRFLLAHLSEPPRVVCLPTAAGTEGPERIRYWSDLGTAHFIGLGVQAVTLPVIDRSSANDPGLAGQLQQANFVYLSGGKPGYLYDTMKDSLAWEAIQSVLQNGGILAGCSAGAMILGEAFPGFPGKRQGFNLVPGAVILPHFDEIPPAMIQPFRLLLDRKLALLGVEGFTALVCSDNSCQVVGRGGVTVIHSRRKQRYLDGQMVSWT